MGTPDTTFLLYLLPGAPEDSVSILRHLKEEDHEEPYDETASCAAAQPDDAAELHRRSDGMYYLALNNGVWSNHLQVAHEYTISDGDSTHTITASALTYARSCANKSDETTANLGKALYLYNRAAITAFGE